MKKIAVILFILSFLSTIISGLSCLLAIVFSKFDFAFIWWFFGSLFTMGLSAYGIVRVSAKERENDFNNQ